MKSIFLIVIQYVSCVLAGWQLPKLFHGMCFLDVVDCF
jgi:hypothetical protein